MPFKKKCDGTLKIPHGSIVMTCFTSDYLLKDADEWRDECCEMIKRCDDSQEHAYKEGEGDRSLEYWRKVHIDFLTRELAEINKAFTKKTQLVCEEFELVYA